MASTGSGRVTAYFTVAPRRPAIGPSSQAAPASLEPRADGGGGSVGGGGVASSSSANASSSLGYAAMASSSLGLAASSGGEGGGGGGTAWGGTAASSIGGGGDTSGFVESALVDSPLVRGPVVPKVVPCRGARLTDWPHVGPADFLNTFPLVILNQQRLMGAKLDSDGNLRSPECSDMSASGTCPACAKFIRVHSGHLSDWKERAANMDSQSRIPYASRTHQQMMITMRVKDEANAALRLAAARSTMRLLAANARSSMWASTFATMATGDIPRLSDIIRG